jgi:hypothetical protein
VRELSLHILDVAENSIAAGATRIEISVRELLSQDELWITIQDNGRGMTPATIAQALDPFYTSRTTRKVGLGLPLLKDAAQACNGFLKIDSTPGEGTVITVKFQHSHIDRMPLGDLADTFLTLLIGAPEVNWIFEYQVNDQRFHLDDAELKAALDGVALTNPGIIELVSRLIREGLAEAHEAGIKQGAYYANN